MSPIINQRIAIDPDVLRSEITALEDAAAALERASGAVGGSLSGVAFGALNEGVLVPLVNELAASSRELLTVSAQLAHLTGRGATWVRDTFTTIENEATEEFGKADAS